MSKPLILKLKEKVEGTILYESDSGTNETITLNDNISNYKDVEIEYKCLISEIEVFGKVKIGKNQTRVNLQANYIGSTNNWLVNKNIKLLGNKITFETWSQLIFNNQGGIVVYRVNELYNNTGDIFITKVVGYK